MTVHEITYRDPWRFKHLLNEMPYIMVDGAQFDLELEQYHHRSPRGLAVKMKALMHGEPITDKHGNVLQLTTPEARATFRQQVAEDPMVHSLRHQAGVDVLWLIDAVTDDFHAF